MTGLTSLAAASGLVALTGLWLVGSGVRRRPVASRHTRTTWAGWLPRLTPPSPGRTAVVAAIALGTLLLTQWPVAAGGAGLAAVFATSPALRQRVEDAEKAEALTVWAEMLRDATGTPRGIEGVLVATASGAPDLIRPHATRLARRLPYEPLGDALDGLADDLDHPVGDLVVTALRLAARSGGRQIRAVLDDLATVAREEARMLRRIEVARARPRADMRAVLLIMAGFVGLFILLGRRYLEPYGTPLGQLVLGVVTALWWVGIWSMGRLSQRRPVERFLAVGGSRP